MLKAVKDDNGISDVERKEQEKCCSTLYPSLTGHKGPLLDSHPPPPYHQPALQPRGLLVAKPEVHEAKPAAPPLQAPLPQPPPPVPASVFSPISSHTRSQQRHDVMKDETMGAEGGTDDSVSHSAGDFGALQMPMIQVMGNDGPALVFRPWNPEDMKQAAKLLPPCQNNGQRFAEELLSLCHTYLPTSHELRRLLISVLTPAQFERLRRSFPAEDVRPTRPDWDNRDNDVYTQFCDQLCGTVKIQFPVKVNMTAISRCKQTATEAVADYMTRLRQVYTDNCGVEEPADPRDTPWETHLCHAFLEGILPNLRDAVQQSCICYEEARLDELQRHALHAERQEHYRKDKAAAKSQKLQTSAQLTMMQMLTQQQQPHRQPQHRQANDGCCFFCGGYDHFVKDCPEKKRQQRSGPRRGGGSRGFHDFNNQRGENNYSRQGPRSYNRGARYPMSD